MRLRVGRSDHDGGRRHRFGGQRLEHSGAPNFAPGLVECLGRAVFLRRIAPAQLIAVDEDYPARNTTIIDPWAAMSLRKERLEPSYLLVAQPEKIAHHTLSWRVCITLPIAQKADQWALTIGQCCKSSDVSLAGRQPAMTPDQGVMPIQCASLPPCTQKSAPRGAHRRRRRYRDPTHAPWQSRQHGRSWRDQ